MSRSHPGAHAWIFFASSLPAWDARRLGTAIISLDFSGATTLKRIKPHRLAALILEDVARYPKTKMGDIHKRIGLEIPRSRIRRTAEELVRAGKLHSEGERNGTRHIVSV